jgi:hypothetical protein
MIEVIATELGYYGNKLRPEGSKFSIKKNIEFSERWMERVEVKKAPAPQQQNQKGS